MSESPAPLQLPAVTVRPTKDGYHLTCKALGIFCTASTIEAGYAALREIAEKAGALSPVSADNFSSSASEPATASSGDTSFLSRSSRLLFFLTALAVLPLVLLAAVILNDVRTIVRDVRSLTSVAEPEWRTSARAASTALSQIADRISMLTPERQEEMRQNIQLIAEKLAPVAEGARPLFEAVGLAAGQSDSPPPPQPDTKDAAPK